ncbi:MAG: tetratricopeptide repeat protein [Candidatus Margulisbacteria bacterium]|jgi:tetratricopeptide (TPR) repeat protein|nr:tetratricopeptide repeat protein [Candidatus Margulisiibacteriota bacterium]
MPRKLFLGVLLVLSLSAADVDLAGHQAGQAMLNDIVYGPDGRIYKTIYRYYDQHNPEIFVSTAREKIAAGATEGFYYEALALDAVNKLDAAEAGRLYQEALRRAPTDDMIQNNSAVFYLVALSDFTKAEALFRRAYARPFLPGFKIDYFENLLAAYLARQKYREAIAWLDDYLSQLASAKQCAAALKNSLAGQAYGALAASLPNMDQASRDRLLALSQKWAKKFPDSAYLQMYYGLCLHETAPQKNRKKYRERLTRAYQLDPSDQQIQNNYAACLVDNAEYAEAIRILQKAHAEFPQYFYPPYNLGYIYFIQRDYAEAEKWYLLACGLDPQNEQALAELLNLYESWSRDLYDRRQYADGLAAARKMTALAPRDFAGYFYEACFYAALGARDAALDSLEKAITLAPDKAKKLAAEETDFVPLRGDPRFQELLK